MEKLDYTRHYKNWHSDSESHINQMVSFYQKNIIQLFPNQKDSKVLDIGCGMGFLLMALDKSGYSNARGIDIDSGQVTSCQKKGLKVEQVEDTVAFLSQNENTFDCITAFDVVEHIPPNEQIKFIKAVNLALKKGGRFVCSVPNASSILGNRNRYIDYTHWVTFTEISLDFVLYNGGFNKIEIEPMEFIHFSLSPLRFVHWVLFKFNRFFRRLSFVAELGFKQGATIPLSFNLIGKAIKD